MGSSSLSLILHFSLFLLQCRALEYGPYMAPLASQERNSSLFSFNNTWQVLGPFQVGTREAVWGADPLEYIGGFRSLSFDPAATFWSPLSVNGTAKWNTTNSIRTSITSTSANTSFSLNYSDIDWSFLRAIYGWVTFQFQAWVRGQLIIAGKETQHVTLHIDGVLEYWVDDEHFFGGDFYGFRKALPVLHLKPGAHKIDIRLIRDVRVFGGISEPKIEVELGVQQVSGLLELSKPGILVSDVVGGKLATPIASISLRNNGEHDIVIIEIRPSNMSNHLIPSCSNWDMQSQAATATDSFNIHFTGATHFNGYNSCNTVIVAGQTRAVTFNLLLHPHNTFTADYTVVYKHSFSNHLFELHVNQRLRHVSIHQPHKITFLHPGGMTSYAMLRSPPKHFSCRPDQRRLPVLLALHGAGLEADSAMVTGALDAVSDLCVWVIFPTGVTPWSGDDWHSWGFADVEAAIKAVPGWIKAVGWEGPDIDIGRWIVTGHSNGGQGAWYALTHHPDKVLAAAPVSGYASIQKYVPYEFWQPADPRRLAVISGSLNSYRHEMLMSNVRGIPIQQQHGEIDDNVPAYHSRFLSQQLHLAGAASDYVEIVGKNHWWEGVMTTSTLIQFYHKQAKNQDKLPRKLREFSLIVGDPGDTSSKGGITISALKDPGQYGRVDVKGHVVTTSNVVCLDFDPLLWNTPVVLNGQIVDLAHVIPLLGRPISVHISHDRRSVYISDPKIRTGQRRQNQMGSMNAILRTQGPFIVRHNGSDGTTKLALQISRNLHQYFQADCLIESSPSYQIPPNMTGNIITLAIGSSLDNYQPSFPIRVSSSGVSIRDHQSQDTLFGDEARGAAFLRPHEKDRLDLVLWGANYEGLHQAARLVPSLTGVGQPDFAVLGSSTKWRGIEGAVALGFFDSNWKVTASSVIENR